MLGNSQVSIPSRGSGKGDLFYFAVNSRICDDLVSIPSRGSGKGDPSSILDAGGSTAAFQSPLGEVVKETSSIKKVLNVDFHEVSIPSRGSGKGDAKGGEAPPTEECGFNPLSGKW